MLTVDVPGNIPEKYQDKYAEIAEDIVLFCEEHLDSEFSELCIHALQKLCRKKTDPMASGRNNMWTAGIIYAIAQNCNVIGNNGKMLIGRPRYRLKADDICAEFGVSKGGVSEKAKAIRKELSITQNKNEWLIPSMHDANNVRKDLERLLQGKK